MDWLIEKDDNNTSNYSRYKKEKKKYIKILAEKNWHIRRRIQTIMCNFEYRTKLYEGPREFKYDWMGAIRRDDY